MSNGRILDMRVVESKEGGINGKPIRTLPIWCGEPARSWKRANLYSDYSLAVWNDSGELVTVAKAYSGLTNEEAGSRSFVRKNLRVNSVIRGGFLNSSLKLPLRVHRLREA